jgi:hypothetical protein
MLFFLLYLLLVGGVISILNAWRRYGDLFHPTVVMMPQVLYIYFALPYYGLMVNQEEFLWRGGSWEGLEQFQAIVLLMAFSLQGGIWLGARFLRVRLAAEAAIREDAAFNAAVVFGLAGIGAWLYGVNQVGGFETAYGHAYGGGWDDSGYIREATQVGIVAVPLLMLARRSRGMSKGDWVLVLTFVLPLLIHGILGARRGPTFVGLATVAASYIIIFRPRIPFVVGISGAAATGFLLLYLVANRGSIYLGSTSSADASITKMMENWSGNEYLYSSALYRYVEATGESYGGLRLLVHEIGRIIPHSIWPTKYEDIGAALKLNFNSQMGDVVKSRGVANVVGWKLASGSAPGFVGDFWLEFGIGAPLVIAAVGWIYGRFWMRARRNPKIQVIYVLLAALSIFLITQEIDAWLFRCAIYAGPAWAIIKLLERRRSVRYVRANGNVRSQPGN